MEYENRNNVNYDLMLVIDIGISERKLSISSEHSICCDNCDPYKYFQVFFFHDHFHLSAFS